ncbi:MAG: methyltransferase domain-containing protein [Polaromonas sp.]|nr:methyltransferase domain-containing protein [Polaromonas sp.]
MYMRKAFNFLTRGNTTGTLNEATRNDWVRTQLGALSPGKRLLDAGAGEQQYRKYCTHLEYVSQDFAQYDGSGDKTGLQTGKWDNSNLDIVSDITSIPVPDESFDVVLCTEVFEHLPDPARAIKEFSRVLKSGGELIITAPFCSLTHFAPYHFATGFNRYFYESHFAANGLQAASYDMNGNYFDYVAQEVRRIESVAETYAARRHVHVWERLAIWVVLNMLKRMSRSDGGSGALLTFGYHIRAVKG